MSIESEEDVCQLIVLCKSFDYVSLYVEHNDEVQHVEYANNGNNSDDGHNDYMVHDKYEEYGPDVKDEEDLGLKIRENYGQSCAFNDIYLYYQDSDDANSSIRSDDDDPDRGIATIGPFISIGATVVSACASTIETTHQPSAISACAPKTTSHDLQLEVAT
ncbi:hypothetical protein Cgig2_023446 [Carnegiea gigantea]|uniref:Uncharacterized protein n=1 Tax=Carnegiea gigantea TaxID=171969 RepID=A0A9Q1JGD1_9CARY|nr:hypothetical protein Cgig2_023446 [Carnegiea gigantea]